MSFLHVYVAASPLVRSWHDAVIQALWSAISRLNGGFQTGPLFSLRWNECPVFTPSELGRGREPQVPAIRVRRP